MNHLKLFNVLSDHKIPFFIIKVIVNWYSKMFASVRWNGVFSNMLPIKRGVLQGSILSPSLFNLYVDVIIVALSKAGYGCFIRPILHGLHSLRRRHNCTICFHRCAPRNVEYLFS